MIKFALALLLASPFVMEEEVPSVEVVEEVEISEEEADKENYEFIIEQLTTELEKLKAYTENETIKTLIQTLFGFVAVLSALFIKFKSFDKATLSLDASKQLLEIAKAEIKNLTEDTKELAKEVNSSKLTTEALANTFVTAMNTINKSLLRLTDRIEALEKQNQNDVKED